MKMFEKHVTKHLSAYCNGELASADSQRVAEHLLGCERCRKEYEEIRLGVRLAEQLPLVIAPQSLWSEIEAQLSQREPSEATIWLSLRNFWISRYRLAAVAALLLIVAGVAAELYFTRQRRPPKDVAAQSGNPPAARRLKVGEWLETDRASRALVDVEQVGQVEVDPHTRIGLLQADENQYRLALERGRVQAKISAPPRFFFVDTPSAVAVDLGCSYSLEVDDAGNGLLHVTGGYVELVLNGRKSTVLAEASCATRPGLGPGTPYADDASRQFRDALAIVDFDENGTGREAALAIVLAEARKRDGITLWHLLQRVEGAEREKVYDSLARLVAPPKGVTREGVLKLDQKMLDDWSLETLMVWFQ
jgi:hypothetical protein